MAGQERVSERERERERGSEEARREVKVKVKCTDVTIGKEKNYAEREIERKQIRQSYLVVAHRSEKKHDCNRLRDR